MKQSFVILIIIIGAQFCCTSLWFAGNAVMPNLIDTYALEENVLGHITAAVQIGFIIGTLFFAVFTIVDRYSPSKVFFTCALLGALFNLGALWDKSSLTSLFIFRLTTGFFLAGIYPVGMKIATDHFDKSLSKSLGLLVGALVLGTAFPHLLTLSTLSFPWQWVFLTTSILAAIGGAFMRLAVPDGPYRMPISKIELSAFFRLFKRPQFRSAAFGYFGHMWELYAFWTFIPILFKTYMNWHPSTTFNIPFWSFSIIGIGALASSYSGVLSVQLGAQRTAFTALLLSCICCLISPLLFYTPYKELFLGVLLFWGMMVIADSPVFSTLIANSVPSTTKGTALTIVNCIGFSITIISIQLLSFLNAYFTDTRCIYMILAIGPLLGLFSLLLSKKKIRVPK